MASSGGRLSRPLVILCALWLILGAVVTIYYFLPANIFDPSWGFPLSPSRLGVFDIIAFATSPPIAILVIADQIRRPSWLAPRGRFIEGRKYSVFPARRYVEIAFLAALLLAFNNITLPFPGVSLVVIGLLFGAAYFGPLTVYLANWLANLLGAALGMPFALGLGGLIGMVGRSLFDGAIFAFASWYFFRYIVPPEGMVSVSRKLGQYVAWFVGWNAVHLVFWTAISIPVLVGNPGWWGYVLIYVPTNYPTNIISGIVGVLAAEAAIRGTRRQAAPTAAAAAPTAPPM